METNLFLPPPKTPSSIELLQKLAGYTTDWNFQPSEYENDMTCPYCGHELEIHLHRGVDCPQCGSEFEMGKGGTLLPSDKTIDDSAKLWPDTLPWGPEGDEYYRNASIRLSTNWGESYPFLLNDSGWLKFGPPGNYHESIYARLKQEGSQYPPDVEHGRYYPDAVGGPKAEMYTQDWRDRPDYDHWMGVVRRNAPPTKYDQPVQQSLEDESGWAPAEDEWTPQF